MLDQYFDELGTVLEAHGGRIEKRIGDAMVTVFGLPVASPDDVLRAVQAVAESQARWQPQRPDRAGVGRAASPTARASAPAVSCFVEAGAGHRVMAGGALAIASALEPWPRRSRRSCGSTVEALGGRSSRSRSPR